MGGQQTGEAWIDKIGFLPDIDTYAYRFGDFVAYWDADGSGKHHLCGHDRDFTESPQYFNGGC